MVQALLLSGKEYVCVMRLHSHVSEDRLKAVLDEFSGAIYQRPPVRASVKRRLRIRKTYYLNLLETDGRNVLFQVGCEAGTYIRKLCLSGDTELILSNGEIITIKEFVESLSNSTGSCNVPTEYGIISFENGRLANNRIVMTQKFHSPKKLITIKMHSGMELKLTDDHEVLISTMDGPRWVCAKSLKGGDLAYSPRELVIEEDTPYIVDFLDDDFLVYEEKLREMCISGFREKYGSIRGMSKRLRIDRKPFYRGGKSYIRVKYVKAACDWNKLKDVITSLKTERGRIVRLKNTMLTENLMYLLGLIASDGCLVFEKKCVRPSRVKFHNSSRELINAFVKIHTELFPSIPVRVKNTVENLFEVDTNNPVLASIAYSLGIKGPEREPDPKRVIKLSKPLIRGFLKGYFDGDGTAHCRKKGRTHTIIEISTISWPIAKRLHQLLKRVGIRSKICAEKVRGSFKTQSGFIHRVRLVSPYDKLKFINEVGCVHPRKKEVMQQVKTILKRHVDEDSLNYAPLHVKKLIQGIFVKYKLSAKKLNLGGDFESVLRSHKPMTKHLLRNAIEKLKNYANQTELSELNSILNSKFYTEKVKVVDEITSKSKYVYDITVENTHNFIPEGSIVISNCFDLGEALGCGAHMGELRRTRAGPFTEDEGMVTLHDVSYMFTLWRESGNESMLRRFIFPMEKALELLPKIYIRDSAVDAICHGAHLAAPGVLSIETGIKPNDVVVIFTQKGEAVALAKVSASTEDIIKMDHGFVARTQRVLMPRGTYPKAWRSCL